MSYDGVIDPVSSAALAGTALGQALDALARAALSAKAAAASADAAAASQASIAALLTALGVAHRWTGTSLQIRLPDGSYGVAVDLQGAAGPAPNIVIASVSTGTPAFTRRADSPDAAPVYDVMLPAPLPGPSAWTPTLALVADGDRRVQQVVDWTGGGGSKPAVGWFLGPAGFVATAALATDLRGATGVSGANFIGSSTTPLAIALGTVSVVLASPQSFAAAQYEALVSAANPANAMTGQLQSYDPASGTLVLNVLQAAGGGTHSDWIVTASPPLFVPTGIDGGYAGDPVPPVSASTVYGASTATTYYGVDGGQA